MPLLSDLPVWQASDEYKQLQPQIAAVLLYGLLLAREQIDDAADDDTAAILDAAEHALMTAVELPEGGYTMSYVRVSHTLSVGTGGGTALSGAWRTRPLNTIDNDDDGISTLSSNAIGLPAGTYRINSQSHHSNSQNTSTRLKRVSDSAILAQSVNAFIAFSTTDVSVISDEFTLSSTDEILLEYRVSSSLANTGLGNPLNFATDEIYAVVEIWKIA